MMPLVYPKYSLWLILTLLILLPGTQADDDWDDFTNDLATDLVSSLFGWFLFSFLL